MAFPTEERYVAEAESKLGRELPDALRKRLLASNGGEIEVEGENWVLFPVWDPSDRNLATRTTSHVVLETHQAREWRRFPRGAVALAGNGFGDLLILRAGSSVFEVWWHETGESNVVSTELDVQH